MPIRSSFSAIFSVLVLVAACAPKTTEVEYTRTERQILGMVEKFDRWDFNGDGRLTIDELNEAARISGYTPQEILDYYDTNGDGAITLTEAQAGYDRIQNRQP